jgi:hypothetical protein
MMNLEEIYTSYFQKSKIFLYPLLGIARGAVETPEQTYLAYGDMIRPEHMLYLCRYTNRTDTAYLKFEKERLMGHPLFRGYFVLEDKSKLFMFDYSSMGEDWFHLLNGRYSQVKLERRKKILNHFEENTANYVYIESYLFPKKYMDQYARILNVRKDLLEQVGELCDKPDLIRERVI